MSSTHLDAVTSDGAQPLTLTDRMPAAWKLSGATTGVVAVLGAVFFFTSWLPLSHTDVFGHLSYGRLIWQSKAIPATEPFMPLAEGMPLIDTAWLTQLLQYGLYKQWDYSALRFLQALCVTGCFALLSRRLFQRTASPGFVLLGMASFALVAWVQLSIVRPQTLAMLCFLALLALLTVPRWKTWHWFVLPAVMALWANLHGSFLVGGLVLTCMVAGRVIDVCRRSGGYALLKDRPLRRLALMWELGIAATCFNPYGAWLYAEVLPFSQNMNLDALPEWAALQFRSGLGQASAIMALGLCAAYRWSPRRVTSAEVLCLVSLGVLALWSQRMLVWWAPVASLCLVTHLHAAWRVRHARVALPEGHTIWTFLSLLLVWVFFALTPFGMRVVNGTKDKRPVNAATPVMAVNWLKANPPKGQVFNIMEWGDYLVWAGPPGVKVFATSHAHLIPADVWRHYMQVIEQKGDWQLTLDKYGVNTVLLDKYEREALVDSLRDADDKWTPAYEDGMSIVFERKVAKAGDAKAPATPAAAH